MQRFGISSTGDSCFGRPVPRTRDNKIHLQMQPRNANNRSSGDNDRVDWIWNPKKPGELKAEGTRGTDRVEWEYIKHGEKRRLKWRSLEDRSHEDDSVDVDDIIAVHAIGEHVTYKNERPLIIDKECYKVHTIGRPDGKFKFFTVSSLPLAFLRDFPPITSHPKYLSLPRNRDGSPSMHIIISTLAGTQGASVFFKDVVKTTLAQFFIFDYEGSHFDPKSGVVKWGWQQQVQTVEKSYIIHETDSAESVTELTKSVFLPRAQEGMEQTIIVLSGDGGVLDITNALLTSPKTDTYVKPVLGLLALGTGNALAHSTGITTGNTLGLANLLRGTPKPLPIFKATFSPRAAFFVDEGRRKVPLNTSKDGDSGLGIIYGAVVASWGFHASLVADSDTAEYRQHGAERFQMAAKELLSPSDGSTPHRYRAKVTMMKRSSEESGIEAYETINREDHMYILATLVSNLEKNLLISPSSKPLDGQLRLVHFGPLPADEVMNIMGLAYQDGRHVKEAGVGYDDVEGIRIDYERGEKEERWRRVCIDGKIVVVNEGGWVEVKREHREVVDIIHSG
ncbi:MAG: hypothetical protein M1827_005999 [Pycnora praestabilis]|nr:MAG: hypothetical protein M1827_005999 [Pycnora praestabilis]